MIFAIDAFYFRFCFNLSLCVQRHTLIDNVCGGNRWINRMYAFRKSGQRAVAYLQSQVRKGAEEGQLCRLKANPDIYFFIQRGCDHRGNLRRCKNKTKSNPDRGENKSDKDQERYANDLNYFHARSTQSGLLSLISGWCEHLNPPPQDATLS